MLLVLSYTVFKLQSLLAASDYSVTKNVQFEYYKPEDVFGFEDNFQIAAAFNKWDGEAVPIEDPSIGELKFVMKAWGSRDWPNFFTELPSHYCTQKELNDIQGSNTNSTFFPVSPLSAEDV